MMEELLPNEIYLLIGEGDEGSTIWCDHIPNDEMKAVKYTRATGKMKRVDFDEMKTKGEGPRSPYDFGWDSSISTIKSKYGDLYVEARE